LLDEVGKRWNLSHRAGRDLREALCNGLHLGDLQDLPEDVRATRC
jgi:hypothetical protein